MILATHPIALAVEFSFRCQLRMVRLYLNEVVTSIRSSCPNNSPKALCVLPINIASEGGELHSGADTTGSLGKQSKLIGTESLADAEGVQNPDESWLTLPMYL
jgi:hypothetical protein